MELVLYFEHAGTWYKVKEDGSMLQIANTYNAWNKTWRLLGVSKRHWARHVTVPFEKCWDKPECMIGGLVWDVDHGTTRLWMGGRPVARVTRAYKGPMRPA